MDASVRPGLRELNPPASGRNCVSGTSRWQAPPLTHTSVRVGDRHMVRHGCSLGSSAGSVGALENRARCGCGTHVQSLGGRVLPGFLGLLIQGRLHLVLRPKVDLHTGTSTPVNAVPLSPELRPCPLPGRNLSPSERERTPSAALDRLWHGSTTFGACSLTCVQPHHLHLKPDKSRG